MQIDVFLHLQLSKKVILFSVFQLIWMLSFQNKWFEFILLKWNLCAKGFFLTNHENNKYH